jgi:glycosyltransferase involved in cell wall biosynthesis
MLLASLGRYRLRTMQQVQNALGDELQLHAGTEPYDRTVKVLGPSDLNMTVVKNFYAPGGILWQGVSWPAALSVPVLVIDLNPRVLTNWVLLVWRRIAGRHTILWGHAFPRRGRRSMTDIVRGAMRTLASGVLSYTSTEADILKRIHSMPIHVAPNALYLSEEMGFTDNGERPDVVYVGRLVAEKKPELLVRGFEIAAP